MRRRRRLAFAVTVRPRNRSDHEPSRRTPGLCRGAPQRQGQLRGEGRRGPPDADEPAGQRLLLRDDAGHRRGGAARALRRLGVRRGHRGGGGEVLLRRRGHLDARLGDAELQVRVLPARERDAAAARAHAEAGDRGPRRSLRRRRPRDRDELRSALSRAAAPASAASPRSRSASCPARAAPSAWPARWGPRARSSSWRTARPSTTTAPRRWA